MKSKKMIPKGTIMIVESSNSQS